MSRPKQPTDLTKQLLWAAVINDKPRGTSKSDINNPCLAYVNYFLISQFQMLENGLIQ